MEQYLLTIFSVIFNILLLYGFNKYLEKHNDTVTRYKAIENGLKSLIKTSILHDYTTYVKHGFIPVEEMNHITELYEAYKGLKGNGTVDVIYKHILEIPVVQSQNRLS